MVFTLDKRKQPLGHCTPKRARQLIEKGRACVYRYFPFTIILKDIDIRELVVEHCYKIKLDPGSMYTGISVVEDDRVIAYFELQHKGNSVVNNLIKRAGNRRNRRSRETIYRPCKFSRNNTYETNRPVGWLPPSQLSIADNVIHFINKLIRLLGPCEVEMELVKFDTQLLENPDIEGKDYQHGTLYGYEMKSYLMEKYHHTCQYCNNKSGDKRLEWEHMIPRTRGGSDRLPNATLACHSCNQEKGSKTPQEWLNELETIKRPDSLTKTRIECLEKVIAGKKVGQNLRYAAWSNKLRWYLYEKLSELSANGKVKVGTGGTTAYNRKQLGIPKAHHLDALCCTKDIPPRGYRDAVQPCLVVKAMGRGTRFIGQANECGIITVKYYDHHKRVNGLQTGDIVSVHTPNGKYAGEYTGRIMVRNSGAHDIRTLLGERITTTKKSIIKILQRMDGYNYSIKEAIPLGD